MGFPQGWTHRPPKRRSELQLLLQRAFTEFLTVPLLVVLAFVLLAVGMYLLDRSGLSQLVSLRTFLKHFLGSETATSSLLGSLAGSLITVTSITFSILLLAVQQTASALTSQVFDQFLRRRLNQVFFGFFVGTALYALIILATMRVGFNPVISVSIALFLAIVALSLLIVLLYSTIDQMRPSVIIRAIHTHVREARKRQQALLRDTRRAPTLQCSVCKVVRTTETGFVTNIDISAITSAMREIGGDMEIVLFCRLGSHLLLYSPMAEIRATRDHDFAALEQALQEAIRIDVRRDIRNDPGYGIEQLQLIAWTSVAAAKSNVAPGILTVRMLSDLLVRWAGLQGDPDQDPDQGPNQGPNHGGRADHSHHRPAQQRGGAHPNQPTPASQEAASQSLRLRNETAPPQPISSHQQRTEKQPTTQQPYCEVVYFDDVPQQLAQTFEALAVAATTSKEYRIVVEIARTYTTLLGTLTPEQEQRAEQVIRTILPTLDSYELTSGLYAAFLGLEKALLDCGHVGTARSLRRTIQRMERRILPDDDPASPMYNLPVEEMR